MQLELVDDPGLESYHKDLISGSVDDLYRLDKPLVSRKMQGDSTVHKLN